ncbi:glutathione S-transferase family protein [Aliishimia ponticola]|uniref:Glutathione S-transferase family protein n=1 Tax=Aliishimia ponticola TaxID=2499833 RepID=A0A4S4NBI9_9RHOB|nr:glutathione S-transferase family protein [Aliishimia ponticola]THH36776.1 glutathione S-transferase family protein [Aliishimia ponticola]
MRLYYAPGTISVAVAIALEEAGLDYTPVLVDFATAQQTTPDYQQINPKGRVPALDLGGPILTETGAILEYIGAQAPQLVPEDAVEAARMRAVMFYLASTMHVNHAHKMRGHRWADREDSWQDMAAKVPETMTASAAYVEDNCITGPLVAGEAFSLADPYLFVICTWLEGDGVDVSRFARIAAFREAMEARQSVKTVREKGMLA